MHANYNLAIDRKLNMGRECIGQIRIGGELMTVNVSTDH